MIILYILSDVYNFSDSPLAINCTFVVFNCTFQSDDKDSLSMCEQCKKEVLNSCSLIPIILSVAVTCLLTIIIHVIIIVVFTITMKRKSK